MSFGRRLGRLAKGTEAASPSPSLKGDRGETLARLRAEMAEILGRVPQSAPPPADPASTTLPFLRIETAPGPLCQRLELLKASHHVGRIPVDGAAQAEAELLALLALDPGLAAASPAEALFLDTETTGLGGGAGTLAFLVGLAAFDAAGRLEVEQLLLQSPSEERALLVRLEQRVAAASMLVTFNGKSFDWPLLRTRFVMNRMTPPDPPPHLDLLHVARRLHRARIGVCSLKGVESQVLGFDRDGDIDGVDVAARYTHFLRTGDESALAAVVEHNFWDVISMAALVTLYGEPVGALHEADLVGLARTLQRARAWERAHAMANVAVEQGAGSEALRVRGDIAKARGDRDRALADYEALSGEIDDPRVRLELAKLYEHHVKQPAKALELLARGTGEGEEALVRRRTRLERKASRPRARSRRSKG